MTSIGNLTDQEYFPHGRPTMKALVIGAGGVGRAIANIASRRPFISSMVIADRILSRA